LRGGVLVGVSGSVTFQNTSPRRASKKSSFRWPRAKHGREAAPSRTRPHPFGLSSQVCSWSNAGA